MSARDAKPSADDLFGAPLDLSLLRGLSAAGDVEVDAQRAVFDGYARLPWAERVALGVAWPALRDEERQRSRGRDLVMLR